MNPSLSNQAVQIAQPHSTALAASSSYATAGNSSATSHFDPIDPTTRSADNGDDSVIGDGHAGASIEDDLDDSGDDLSQGFGGSLDNKPTSVDGGGGGGGEVRRARRFWQTSVGKFKNNLHSLPQTMQYIYQLLTELPTIEKPDILYYILQCLSTLALHGDVLTLAANQYRGFFLWCQENLLIQK